MRPLLSETQLMQWAQSHLDKPLLYAGLPSEPKVISFRIENKRQGCTFLLENGKCVFRMPTPEQANRIREHQQNTAAEPRAECRREGSSPSGKPRFCVYLKGRRLFSSAHQTQMEALASDINTILKN